MAAIAFVVLGGVAHAATTPGVKCAAAKQKAASKKIASKLKCYAKAAAKAVTVDPTCLGDADTKFSDAITKADSKGGCVVTNDAPSIEGAADACVTSILSLTPTAPPTCGNSAYPTCGGTCAAGQICQAVISQDTSGGCGLTDRCSTSCQCVDELMACNGQPCGRICFRFSQCAGNMESQTTESCCSGADQACLVTGTPTCCCAGSCVQPVGSLGSCDQQFTCNAAGTSTQCH
jgi:hypothetical protein